MTDAIVGIVANPMSGRDIRRLVASASVFPTAEKANMVQRMLTGFGLLGVDRVLMSTDLGGISAAVYRAVRTHTGPPWPDVDFLDQDPITQTATDTTLAVTRMVAAGARAIVCLGGDGTARVAAAACADVPLMPLSTGTNNAFPQLREATVAGLAVGLLATGLVDADLATHRAGVLEVVCGSRAEVALVDVCVSTARHVGARALWDTTALTELYCCFAEPDAIGLSSIPGQLCPSSRSSPDGVELSLAPDGKPVVYAPIAPGLVVPVGVRTFGVLPAGSVRTVAAESGVIALDGEREIEFGPSGPRPTVRLRADGPRCIDIGAVMHAAAARGLLHHAQGGTG
ncbi:ATP-NAD kinase family protein [Fodinicola acaciae]|uniref:ATP-NAD kinase family protein n=1 Tax=Fodinicola acaciae TaxID=2681555 RepID=UPI0013D6B86D|nr:NAD(+)/NADH kinase [Fodinicola acaciae]